jgi:hypothetical protein
MPQKLIPERIVYTEETDLSAEDILILKGKINQQLKILLPAFLALTGIGLYVWMAGPDNMPRKRYLHLNEDDKQRFWIVAPYVVSFFWLSILIYFSKVYLQTIQPLLKDIKAGKKKFLFFEPKKTAMPVFNKYFVATPIYQTQQIEINREDFENIIEPYLLHIEVAPHSTYILRLKKDNTEINYW